MRIWLCVGWRFEKSGNQELVHNLAQWVFRERGVLRVGQVKHHLQGEKQPPQAYTITQDVVSSNWHYLYSWTSIKRASLLRRFRYNSVWAWLHDGRLLYYCPGDYYWKRNIWGIAGKLGHTYLLCVSQGHLHVLFQSVPSFWVLCKWKSSWAKI